MQEKLLVEAVIEIPKGSQNKYEFDKERGMFRLDRVLYSPVHYPTEYGFIPQTLEEDGDPVDIMVMVSAPTFTGCLIDSRVIGALSMEDDKGVDVKILAVAVNDPRYKQIQSLEQAPPHVVREIEYFFTIYKDLEGKKTLVKGWRDIDFARQVIETGRQRYLGNKGGQLPLG